MLWSSRAELQNADPPGFREKDLVAAVCVGALPPSVASASVAVTSVSAHPLIPISEKFDGSLGRPVEASLPRLSDE